MVGAGVAVVGVVDHDLARRSLGERVPDDEPRKSSSIIGLVHRAAQLVGAPAPARRRQRRPGHRDLRRDAGAVAAGRRRRGPQLHEHHRARRRSPVALSESFEPADGDAVRDQRLLLMQRGALQQTAHLRPGRPFGAPVWILELRDGRLRFIGDAPGRYHERATNNPSWEAMAGTAWRDSRFNPYVDLTPENAWGKISVFARGPTALVDVASERITRR